MNQPMMPGPAYWQAGHRCRTMDTMTRQSAEREERRPRVPVTQTRETINDMTVPQLRNVARGMGVALHGARGKSAIRGLILAHMDNAVAAVLATPVRSVGRAPASPVVLTPASASEAAAARTTGCDSIRTYTAVGIPRTVVAVCEHSVTAVSTTAERAARLCQSKHRDQAPSGRHNGAVLGR